ncbi:MAG: glycosyltransferase family 4 protein [Verrucomicrobiales bacterium]|nr:glycosyltransferase family 4 protein [Verrucomicrobiales bacterium]
MSKKTPNNLFVVRYATHPTAYFSPGGGEVQLRQYLENLKGYDVALFDYWDPQIESIDIVHLFSVFAMMLPLVHELKRMNVKVVVSPNLWVSEANAKDVDLPSVARIFEAADAIVCNSQLEVGNLSAYTGVAREKFHVVYNCFDDSFIEGGQSVENREVFAGKIPERFIFGACNIESRKNLLRSLEAVMEYTDLPFVVAGGCRDKRLLKQLKNLGKDRFVYIGRINSDQLKWCYQRCNVFLLASILETPGIAALEAAASGASVVITDRGSTTEYFEGGIFVDPFSIESIGRGIEMALESSPLTDVTRFNTGSTAAQLSSVYGSIQLDSDPRVFQDGIEGSSLSYAEINANGVFQWSQSQFAISSSYPRYRLRIVSEVGGTLSVSRDGRTSGVFVLKAGCNWVRINDGMGVSRFNVVLNESEADNSNMDMRDLGVMIFEVNVGVSSEEIFSPAQSGQGFYPVEMDDSQTYQWAESEFTIDSQIEKYSLKIWSPFAGILILNSGGKERDRFDITPGYNTVNVKNGGGSCLFVTQLETAELNPLRDDPRDLSVKVFKVNPD